MSPIVINAIDAFWVLTCITDFFSIAATLFSLKSHQKLGKVCFFTAWHQFLFPHDYFSARFVLSARTRMKVVTCEIAWHNKEPVYSLDFQQNADGKVHRLATAGVDTTVRVSELSFVCFTHAVFACTHTHTHAPHPSKHHSQSFLVSSKCHGTCSQFGAEHPIFWGVCWIYSASEAPFTHNVPYMLLLIIVAV